MNKHGLTYKKLGEVCDVERGGSPRPIQEYLTDSEDGINWIKIGDAQEGSKYITSTKERIIPEGVKKSRLVHSGDFILSNSMSFGRPYILKVDGCIHDGWLVIRDKHETFMKDYLYYYLSSPKLYRTFASLAVGGVVNNLNSKLVRNVDVMIPPKDDQKVIVAELDEINEVIAELQQQIVDLDKLEQSTFYVMFGDPVTNERGWGKKSLNDVCVSMTKGPFGSDIKKSLFVPKSKDAYKVYIQINAIQKDVTLGDYYISKEYFDSKLFRFEVKPNDYIITCDGTLGRYIRLPQSMEKGVISASLLKLTLNERINYKYFEFIWDFYILPEQYRDVRNTALKHLPSATRMGKTLIPVPPLDSQKVFAAKIEAIETAKTELNAQIAELQTLLASRMDYYFD